MRSIRLYLVQFIKEEARAGYLLAIFLMLGLLIYVNYWRGLTSDVIGHHESWILNFFGYFLLYTIPFLLAFLLQFFFFKKITWHKSTWFWLVILIAPVLFSIRVNFNFFDRWINDNWSGTRHEFIYYSLNWLVQAALVIIPIYLIWKLKDRNYIPFYGTGKIKNLKPYWLMILFMIPLIAAASTQPDFLAKYPRAQVLLPLSTSIEYLQVFLFELSYGFSFLSIEFFFRGFLVLTLLQCCGTKSIIPIACFYVAIHMGKPMAEAISSFFGGILLGLVTYHTRSIWGGLIVHLGIAWLMEIGGAIGKGFI